MVAQNVSWTYKAVLALKATKQSESAMRPESVIIARSSVWSGAAKGKL